MRLLLLMSPVVLLLGCPRERPPAPAPWPALPGAPHAAAELIKARTRRPVPPAAPGLPRTAEDALALVRRGPLTAGWPAIVAALQQELGRTRRSVLLVGTHHDAGGQVRAFRRLVGPGGVAVDAVGVELLPADGRWQGIPPEKQRGLSQQVARYLRRGDRSALQHVHDALPRVSYTTWKYRYQHELVDLLLAARAARLRLVPCDMPRPVQQQLYAVARIDRLRELHCLLGLGPVLPPRLALLWGQAHLAPDALPRFVPQETRVVAVHLVGHRPGPAGLERELRGRLLLADPLLVPLPTDKTSARFMLLLDGPHLGARVHRARDPSPRAVDPKQRHRLTLTLERPATLVLAGLRRALEAGETVLPLAAETHAYLLQQDGKLLVGALDMPKDGALTLTPQIAAGEVELVVKGKLP